jgi:hypothetical protein
MYTVLTRKIKLNVSVYVPLYTLYGIYMELDKGNRVHEM